MTVTQTQQRLLYQRVTTHEAPVKTLPIQADLSWSPFPCVPLCTAAFSFFFSSYDVLLPFCPFCLKHHLPLFGPETHSFQASLSLCPSSNRVLSLSIALNIRFFFLILVLRPISSKLLFPGLSYGKKRNDVYWNPRHSQGMSLFMVCVCVF